MVARHSMGVGWLRAIQAVLPDQEVALGLPHASSWSPGDTVVVRTLTCPDVATSLGPPTLPAWPRTALGARYRGVPWSPASPTADGEVSRGWRSPCSMRRSGRPVPMPSTEPGSWLVGPRSTPRLTTAWAGRGPSCPASGTWPRLNGAWRPTTARLAAYPVRARRWTWPASAGPGSRLAVLGTSSTRRTGAGCEARVGYASVATPPPSADAGGAMTDRWLASAIAWFARLVAGVTLEWRAGDLGRPLPRTARGDQPAMEAPSPACPGRTPQASGITVP